MEESKFGDNELSDSTGRIIECRESESKSISSILGNEGRINSGCVNGILKEKDE